jgi:Cof subfamily protein (haloacid dehalogenase superfamily)
LIRLVAVDLDGTLFNTDSKISSKNKKALKKCRDSGIKVVIASAKPSYSVSKIIEELDLDGLHISYSGALVINKDLKPFFELKMEPEACKGIILAGRIWKKGITLGLDDGILYYEKEHPYNKIVVETGDKITKVKDLTADNICNKALMFSISGYENDTFEDFLKEKFKDFRIKIMMGSPFSLIINHSDTSKIFALKKILETYDISLKDTMAIGDSYTDISMISEAGIGVAMGNAVSELKEVSDFIVPDNDNDGVATAIGKFIK